MNKNQKALDMFKSAFDSDLNNYCNDCFQLMQENQALKKELEARNNWIEKHSHDNVIFP